MGKTDAKERYVVVMMNGKNYTMVKRNFREVIDELENDEDGGDDKVWQITKMDYKEIE